MKRYICREVPTENGGYLEIETELIRCKDCKWYEPDEYEADYGDCTNDIGMCNAFVYGNDYCSQAGRKLPQVNPEMVEALLDRIEKQRGEDEKTD